MRTANVLVTYGQPKLAVQVASDKELKNREYLHDLKASVARQCIARRQWLDELADTFRDYEGAILVNRNTLYDLPDLDDAFDDDIEMRWLSEFIRPAPDGKPVRLQSRVIERVRIIDLYFRIRYPALASTFGKLRAVNDNVPRPEPGPVHGSARDPSGGEESGPSPGYIRTSGHRSSVA